MALRICLVSEEYPPETGFGGIGTYTHNLANGLVGLGHSVDVVCRTWGPDATRESGGLRVHRLSVPKPRWRRGTRALTWRLAETRQIALWNHRVALAVRRIAAEAPLAVVEAPEYHAQALLTALGPRRVPLVVRLHTPATLLRRSMGARVGGSALDRRISESLERLLARRATLVTSPSAALARDVSELWRLPAKRTRVIPNPIDERLFAPNGAPDEGAILYVGRISRRKGVGTLVQSMPQILEHFPDARLRLVGRERSSQPGERSLGEELRSSPAGRALELAGHVAWPELPQVYGRAAVCVVPSLYESFSYTCVEAMASGRPLVATAVGAIPEVVTDGVDGLLVPPNDPGALAAAVTRVLSDPALGRRLAERGRRTVLERFGRAAACSRMAEAYREAGALA